MPANHLTAKRVIIAVLAAAALCWAICEAARVGLSRTLGEYAGGQRQDKVADLARRLGGVNDQTQAANRAVSLSPSDAETHYLRGDFMQRTEDYQQAQLEFERAVQLRPRDYYLWLLVGVMRDQNHDQEGALRALRQSVSLAPSYAPPHWQLGNLLLRMGQQDLALAELRQAARSDLSLVPNVSDLAWVLYGHDAEAVVGVVQPATDISRMTLAIFFAQHDAAPAAVEQFLLTRAPVQEKSEALLTELLRAKRFAEAYQVWARMRAVSSGDATGLIRDGGFEGPIALGQPGFGWQTAVEVANVTMSIDEGEHQSGARSLRVEFRGASNPGTPVLTQLVLVKPQTHYRLKFAGLSKQFVSAALPVVTVNDAASPETILAQSPTLGGEGNGWRDFAIDFVTGVQSRAIVITLSRQSCPGNPCPAFGVVWLDSFSLESR